ncbi:MAG: glycerophosphodiester phosphodiesterase [Alphaproteobacteria bacterium]|nr:glycerophosphodiester phosphodiesterase [Alphaproteobacteria bacterium]MCW5744517.1 glycerophosphodiester phosphodiesterase [Alphaproteobacteria bacterium]
MRRTIIAASFLLASATAAAQDFDLQGHRGARGLAPENTLAAFRKALEIGVTTIETDLGLTSDGVLVLAHDPRLNPDLARGPDGKWLTGWGPPIRTLSRGELDAYDVGRLNPEGRYARQWTQQVAADGERIPTWQALVALTRAMGRDAVRFNIETKLSPDRPDETADPQTFARAVVEAVRAEGVVARTTIQSFDWRTLLEAKKLAPEIATACLTIETSNMDTVRRATPPSPWHAGLDLAAHGGSLPRLAKAAGCDTWSMFWRNLTPELVKEAKGMGLLVLPWTVNDPGEMGRLIDMGVDGLITDYPDRLRQVMTARGLKLP